MKKEESKKLTSKVDFYFTIINHIKDFENLSEVSKKLKISKQKLNYHARVLKDLGFIEKESYAKWKVKRSKKIDLEHALNWKDKKIRGHAFIWKIKSNRNYDWIKILEKNNINYKLVRGYTPRIFVKNKKVWLGKKSIVVYDNRSFYGKNAIESRKYAVFGLQETIKELQRILGIKFNYIFKPTREHFGMIKNELAQQCNKNKEKIVVRDTLDGEWLWIDDSTGMMGELETGGKGLTKDRAKLNMEVQNWYNGMKETNFKVTPEFILNTMNGIQQNQLIFDKNMKSHLEVLDKIGTAVDELRKEIKNIKKEKQ